ncbi:MAG TPA: hypothetical protein VJT49_16635 [Amycolatopsis sp.]|uniref:hypothetical protein n=1 Tax=Amycolatopsis sp. TaxID=37632 RepID=UPI002B45A095|nr:hypothetical protein [Amycolatopsis sp.]HKS46701.1 hypothetical protein [Amycolatopsis sp.]
MGWLSKSNTTTSRDNTHNCNKSTYLAAIVTTGEFPGDPTAIRTRDRRCCTCGRVTETVVVN